MATDAFEWEMQRLVDGELDRHRIGQMLRQAELRPILWREMALAFIEQQVMSRALSEYVGHEPRKKSDLAAAFGAAEELDDARPASLGETTSAPGKQTMAASYGRIDAWFKRALPRSWLSIAASILICLPLGFWLGASQVGDDRAPLNAGAPSPLAANAPADAAPELTKWDAERIQRAVVPYTMRLVGSDGQPVVEEDIPLIPEELAVELRLRFSRFEIPEDIQNAYRQAGWQLQPRVRYLSGRLEDGRQVVVPIRDVMLVAYGQ